MNTVPSSIASLGLDFDRLSCLTVVSGIAINITPLHIGRIGVIVDYPVERFPDRTIYIPGSSLKGSLRSLAESIARASGTYVCEVFDDITKCECAIRVLKYIYNMFRKGSSEKEIIDNIKKYCDEIIDLSAGKKRFSIKEISSFLNEITSAKSLEELIENIKKEKVPCPVCRIFGNKELASHIEVSDMLPLNPDNVEVDFRTRNAIDRFRGAARSGALFTFEYVSPRTKWKFEMKLINIKINSKTLEAELMRSLLKLLHTQGIQVGRMRSVGMGLLKLESANVIEYSVKDFELVEEYRAELPEVIR